MVKNPPVNAEDVGLIPGSGRSPGERNGNPAPVFLPGESPWTEGPGGLQSRGSQRVRHEHSTVAYLHICMWLVCYR